jgi:hypothetical protein
LGAEELKQSNNGWLDAALATTALGACLAFCAPLGLVLRADEILLTGQLLFNVAADALPRVVSM